MAIKIAGLAPKSRAGRVSGNTPIFSGLTKIGIQSFLISLTYTAWYAVHNMFLMAIEFPGL